MRTLYAAAALLAACGSGSGLVPCADSTVCNLEAGGQCLPSPAGVDLCAYPATACPSGLEWSPEGGPYAGQCVASVDAGTGTDAAADADATQDAGTCAGRHLVYEDDGQVFVTDLSAQPTPIGPGAAPSGSPIGVVFSRSEGGNAEIFRANVDGSNAVNLTNHAQQDTNPVFSPDGSLVAFQRNGALFVMNADGSDQHAVLAGNSVRPRWSPAGDRILVELWGTGGINADLWVVDHTGANLEPVTSLAGNETSATWAPDGTRAAFENGGDIYVVKLDGSPPTNLTNDAPTQKYPAWSPDGNMIALSEENEIRAMSATGGPRTPLSSGARDILPQWSRDGVKLVFTRLSPDNHVTAIVVDANGSNPMTIGEASSSFLNSVSWFDCP